MQELIVAIFGSSEVSSATSPDTREYVCTLASKAYHNIHGQAISTAESAWVSAINTACLQLYKDPKIASLSVRDLVQCFENVIRVSEEHVRISKRHAAMALNVFYLKETALDGLNQHAALPHIQAASPTVISGESSYTGRVQPRPLPQSN